MASKNSVMLSINQLPGIKYHDLLAKIAGEYSNINSARAALSRLVKDLEALGLVRRKENNLFLTDKGVLKIQTEMKNKLLLKLNKLVKEADSRNPDPLVQQLSVLVERSKKDEGLRGVARSTVSFPVSRIFKISEKIGEQGKHLSYLSRITAKHAKALREMNFADLTEVELTGKKKARLVKGMKKGLSGEFIAKAGEKNSELIEKLPGVRRKESVYFQPDCLEKVIDFLSGSEEKSVIVAGKLRVELKGKKAKVIGPAESVKNAVK